MANNTVEIILKAIDNASNVFQSIGSSAESAASEIESSLNGVDADKLANEFKQVDNAIDQIDDHSINEVKNASQQAEKEIKEVGQAAEKADKEVREMGNAAREASSGFSLLDGVVSNVVGMIGYDLVNGFVECGRAAINAQGQLEYFAGRLNMSGSELTNFNNYLEQMQTQFRKVDMTAIGAAAEELAVKLKLPKSSLESLSETIAITSSAFVKEGRTQEDAILAVSDALDGQWQKLKELGITQEDLKNNGWNGDLQDKEGLLKALNKTLEEMGFADTAKDITSLDEAFQALSVAGGDLLAAVLIPITPALVSIMEAAIGAFGAIKGFLGIFTGGADPISNTADAGTRLAESMALVNDSSSPAADGMQRAQSVADDLANSFDSVSGAAGGLPDWAQIALGVTALGLSFALVGAYIQLSLIPALEKSAWAFVKWAATTLVVDISNMTLAESFTAVAASVWAAMLPLLPWIAAIAILAVVVYEVGKAFSWWHDIGSMLEAISAGLQRLWSAFINHPDVQAAIQMISSALQTLWSWITQAGQAVLEFFGINASGNFDIVRALIDGIGAAWNAITFPIRLVISAVQWVIGAFQNAGNAISDFGNVILLALGPIGWIIMGIQRLTGALNGGGGIGDALKGVQQAFTTVWTAISGFVSGIIGPIIGMFQKITSALHDLWTGQINLGQAIGQIWNAISSTIIQVATHIIDSIINFATTLGEWALKAGQAFLTGLISFFTQLPGMIWNILTGVITSIASLFGKGVSEQVGSSLGKLGEVFHSVWNGILNVVSSVIGPIVDMISTLIGVFQQLWSGQISLGEAIGMIWETISSTMLEVTTIAAEYILEFATNVYNWSLQAGEWFLTNVVGFFSQVPGMIWNYLLQAYTFIVTTMSTWITGAVSRASLLVSQVVNWFSQLPSRVWTWLVQVGSRILSAGSQWLSSAVSAASSMVNGVISRLSQLPGKVYNEFMKIPQRIRSAISAAVRAATQFGQDIVQAVLNALHIASPGIIQRKTVGEFTDTVKRIAGLGGDAYNAGQEYGQSIVDGFMGVGVNDALATDLNTGQLFDISTGQSYDVDSTQHIDGEIRISHDLENVPDNLNENQIAELINNSTRSDDFMKRIAESVAFQRYDSREKLRIARRDGRSKGVM